MRIAVIADIHANIHALRAVIDHAQAQGVDAFWCLGDMVGRGTDAIQTIIRLNILYQQQAPQHQAAWLVGNHDLLVTGKLSDGFVNNISLSSLAVDVHHMAYVHRTQLTANNPRHLDWLNSFKTFATPFAGVHLAHGEYCIRYSGDYSPQFIPSYQEYMHTRDKIRLSFEQFEALGQPAPRLIMNGHTHVPRLVIWDNAQRQMTEIKNPFAAGGWAFNTHRTPVYVNPGSVGFSRLAEVNPALMKDNYNGIGTRSIYPTYMILTTDAGFEEIVTEFFCVPYPGSTSFPKNYPIKYRRELESQNQCPDFDTAHEQSL